MVTPENIAFEYRVAGLFGRLMAHLIDLVVLLLLYGLCGLFAGLVFGMLGLPSVGMFVWLVGLFILYWFYGGFFEAMWNGQTPGKRMMGLRVLRTDGRPINAMQAVLRNLLRLFDAMPAGFIPGFFFGEVALPFQTYLVALMATTLTRRSQRVGDLAVGTMVIVEDHSQFGKVTAPDDDGIQELLEKIPANFVPSRTLSRALSHYVGRRRFFGPARRLEIAHHVGSVLVLRLNLPPDTNHDLLLCALYLRAFHERETTLHDEELLAPRIPIPEKLEDVSHG